MKEKLIYSISLFTAIFIASSTVLLIIRKIILKMLHKWAQKTDTKVDGIFLESLKTPSIFWCIAIGLYIAIGTSKLAPQHISYSLTAFNVLIIFSLTLTLSNLSGKIAAYYIKKIEIPIPETGLTQIIIKSLIITIGILILLSHLGISIAPIITALGVGGLAVSLALQDTLSNLFAGLLIIIEKPVKLGDYVKLGSGEEGHIADIGWRTTRLVSLQNNTILIPNNKLSQSIITNFNMPEKNMAVSIPIGVGYNSDPEKVEKILTEETVKGAKDIQGLLTEPKPNVKFIPGFGDSSLNFTLTFQVAEYKDQHPVQHELRKRIFKRFKEEGIEIPFPTRTIYLKDER